jgi:hypothetical protein
MTSTKTYLRDGKHWTKEELNTLLEQHIDGETDKTIAHVLDRRIKGVRIKRTELMRELIDGFTKLDNNGLDKDGTEPGEGYFVTKEQYKKVMRILNHELEEELLNLLIKENLEKNAIMNVLFDNEWVPGILIQEAMDAAMKINDKDVKKRREEHIANK